MILDRNFFLVILMAWLSFIVHTRTKTLERKKNQLRSQQSSFSFSLLSLIPTSYFLLVPYLFLFFRSHNVFASGLHNDGLEAGALPVLGIAC